MQKHGSVRLFKSDFWERFSHVHPITPLIMWTPVISYLLWRAVVVHGLSLEVIAPLGVAGFFVWTLAEYGLHRFVFHYKATSKRQERFVFIMHGLHHEDPKDATRLVMPPAPGLIWATILFFLFRLLLGPSLVEPFFAFFLVGYLCYDYIHFSVHHFTPRTRVGRYLKQSHMMHHFVSPNARWGVSSPLWDYVFNTFSDKSSTSERRH